MSGKFVAYYRVSTGQQGRSGLGLEAQKESVAGFLRTRSGILIDAFTEIESGKHSDRPKLTEALALAKAMRATLIVAKFDRLSRNAAFLLMLRDSGVDFICADMPDANALTVGIMAVIAQAEREAISTRTKEALQAARKRGVRLGNPNGARALKRAGKGNKAAMKAVREMANKRASELCGIVRQIETSGISTDYAIALELNRRGVPTARRGTWQATGVTRLRERLKRIP